MKRQKKYGEKRSCSQFCTNNLFTAVAVLQHFGTEKNTGQVQIKVYRVGSTIVEKQRHWLIQQNEVQVSYDFVF